jgi:hypothetical protein
MDGDHARPPSAPPPNEEEAVPPSCFFRCCSIWTLNLATAALHGVWVIVFVVLWSFDKRADGSQHDIKVGPDA